MRNCKLCLLPETVPGANIDIHGICQFCRDFDTGSFALEEDKRKEREADLEKAIEECRGQAEYDCLVPFSGGKDSAKMLHKLKVEYKLKVLACTTDINIPDIAKDTINRTLLKLDIPYIALRPQNSFYRKIFRYLLQNQEARGAVYTVSYVYAPLFEGDAIKLALQNNIPLILAGYSPGQPEPERMMYEFSRKLIQETDWMPPGLNESGILTEEEKQLFFNPHSYPASTQFPRYLAPFHAWKYDQEEIMKSVVKHGLVKSGKHANPIYSNYPINWLLMYSDLKHFGYNPYHPEFSALIRTGKANRAYWKLMTPIINFMISKKIFLGKEVARQLKILELRDEDLKINKPKGYYDPVF